MTSQSRKVRKAQTPRKKTMRGNIHALMQGVNPVQAISEKDRSLPGKRRIRDRRAR